MKNLLILVGILLTITSCKKANDSVITPENNSRVIKANAGLTVEVIKIEGCDYILCDGIESVSIIHKQNCKNH